MKKIISSLTTVYLLLALSSFAQTKFQKTYAIKGGNVFSGVAPSNDGGYVLAGGTNTYGAGLVDALLMKIDQHGDTVWTKTYGGANYDQVFAISNTTDGGYIMAGYSESTTSAGNQLVYLIKTNANGDTIWTKCYGSQTGNWQALAYSVKQTIDGGYIIAGVTDISDPTYDYDCLAIKTDAAGNVLWTKTFGDYGQYDDYDKFFDVIPTYDGGYLFAGYSKDLGVAIDTIHNKDLSNIYLVKTDANGDTIWSKCYGSKNGEGAFDVEQTADSNYIVTGYTNYTSYNFDKVYVLKINRQGGVIWAKYYGKANDVEDGNYATITSDGNIAVLGNETGASGTEGFYLFKLNAQTGDTLWTKEYVGHYPGGIIQTNDKGFFLAGTVMGQLNVSTSGGGYVVKTDSLGRSGVNANGISPCHEYSTGIVIGSFSTVVNNTTGVVIKTPALQTMNSKTSINTAATPTVNIACSTVAQPEICIVTTDSLTSPPYAYNVVYWQNIYSNVDSFIIYRETILNNYVKIGAIHSDSLGRFVDTARSIHGPSGGDPAYSSYKYKLAIKDFSGNIGPMSAYHQTLFITETGQTFIWTPGYIIETGQTTQGNNYELMRDDNGTNNYHVIAQTTGVQFNDPNYSLYPNGKWRVDADGFNCTTNQRLTNSGNNNTYTVRQKSHSNTANRQVNNINQLAVNNGQVTVYPNPNNGLLNIYVNNYDNASVEIYNLIGEKLLSQKLQSNTTQLNLTNVANGMYQLKLIKNNAAVYQTKISKAE